MAVAELGYMIDSSGAVKAEQDLDGMTNAAMRAEAGQKKLATASKVASTQAGQFAKATGASTGQVANLGAQLNDIGVMLAAGQNPLQLAVQQGTQINQVFAQMGGGTAALRGLAAGFMSMVNPMSLATIGIIAGGAALVQWGMSALSAGEDTEEFTRKLEGTLEAQKALSDEIRGFRLGATADELVLIDAVAAKRAEIAEMQRSITPQTRIQIEAEKDALDVLIGQLDTQRALQAEKRELERTMKGLVSAEAELVSAMGDYRKEVIDANVEAELLRQGLSFAAIDALKLAGVDITSGISAAADEAARLADNLNISLLDAINLKNLQDSLVFSGRGGDPNKFGDPFKRDPNEGTGTLSSGAQSLIDAANRRSSRGSGARRGGGGGRGTADPYQADLEALIESLRTERETIDAWYMESDALLNDRRATELLTAQEHNAAKLALEAEYSARLVEIKQQEAQMVKTAASGMYGELGSLLSSFGEKSRAAAVAALAVNTALRISEVIQNTAAAAVRALAELGPIAGPPAAAKIMAFGKVQAGLIAANAVLSSGSRGGGGGGSLGGSGAPSATATEAAPMQRAIIQINGNRSRFTIDEINDIIMQLQKEAKDGVIIEGFVAT